MPIYAYRCDACGHAKDVLQKVSDARLTACPQCGAQAFQKQVTAAGFQLKGSGWYVTDFKGNGQKPAGDAKGDSAKPAATPSGTAEATGGDGNAAKSTDTAASVLEAKSDKSSAKPASTTLVTKTVDKPPSSAGSGSAPP